MYQKQYHIPIIIFKTGDPQLPFGYDIPDYKFKVQYATSMEDALEHAEKQLKLKLYETVCKQKLFISPSTVDNVDAYPSEMIKVITLNTDAVLKELKSRHIKNTIHLPGWLNQHLMNQDMDLNEFIITIIKERLSKIQAETTSDFS